MVVSDQVSPGETGVRRRVGLILGPLLFLLVLASPGPRLGTEAPALLALFAWTVVY
jgi:hypothetical protein